VAKSCKGDLTGAIDRYRKALAINPNYAEARLALVSVLGAQDRADESDAELALAVQTAASKSTVHLASYRAAGRLGDAIQELEAALLANPRGLTLMTRLASLYADARLDASAQALANRALATWPDSVDAKLIYQIEALSGDPVKAASCCGGLACSPIFNARPSLSGLCLAGRWQVWDAAREQKIFES
jgi:tetratricopeptide (TPR) repeat protein